MQVNGGSDCLPAGQLNAQGLKIRRALMSVSDKAQLVVLAKALVESGAELVATGGTALILRNEGFEVTPVEALSGTPEAFQGRMKSLSFAVCSGILFRRGDASDEKDLKDLKIKPIDCVVVNFYPFEASVRAGLKGSSLIEQIDIGGPTLVRAAAKNAPDVLVLTHPLQYDRVIKGLGVNGRVSVDVVNQCSAEAWNMVLKYDEAIAHELGGKQLEDCDKSDSAGVVCAQNLEAHKSKASQGGAKLSLRYGENPHQSATLQMDPNSPIAWDDLLTDVEVSYNNILDLSAAYSLASDLARDFPGSTGVVIVKHNNPCGVAVVPRTQAQAQKLALLQAWDGDPVSAFGSVIVFTDPLEEDSAQVLAGHFVELVAAPELTRKSIATVTAKRKKLKAVLIRDWGQAPKQTHVCVAGGVLTQSADLAWDESFKSMTEIQWPESKTQLAWFGVLVTRILKSNAIALVREIHGVQGAFQLVGAGQGQPNRIDALKSLAIPRAQAVLRASEGTLAECVMVSDAFFPFRDTVDAAHLAGIKMIVQPGGSIKDAQSIEACNEHKIAMVFTGTRHFKH